MSRNVGLEPSHVLKYVIRPVLTRLEKAQPGMNSVAAEKLVLGTMVYESRLVWMKQLAGGPAMGLGQMEPNTFLDLWKRAAFKPDLFTALRSTLVDFLAPLEQMTGNLYLQVAMCRLLYWYAPGPLPLDIKGLSEYYKKHYNTHLGAGSADGWRHDFLLYLEDAFED